MRDKLLVAFCAATMIYVGAAFLRPEPANAATAYMLNFTHFNPYWRESVAGPFDTLEECQAVERQQTYRDGGAYSCNVFYY